MKSAKKTRKKQLVCIGVRLPKEMLRDVDVLAREISDTRSEFIRRAIEKEVGRLEYLKEI